MMGDWLISHVITTVMVAVSAVTALNEPRNQCLPHAAFTHARIAQATHRRRKAITAKSR
jgi:hypothetical protein